MHNCIGIHQFHGDQNISFKNLRHTNVCKYVIAKVCINDAVPYAVSDNPELDAPVPAARAPDPAEGRSGGGHQRSGGSRLQDVHLSRDRVHRRHRLPEPTGEFPGAEQNKQFSF